MLATHSQSSRVPVSNAHASGVVLSGLYHDVDAREYVILQDRLEHLPDEVWLAHVRVLRQRHPHVQDGTVTIPADLFKAIAPTDAERNYVVSNSLVAWLQHRSMHVRFGVRVTARRDEAGSVSLLIEEAAILSS